MGVVAGVSGTVVSMFWDDKVEKDILEWAAVVLMAFISNILFCCLLGTSVRFSWGMSGSAMGSAPLDSASDAPFLCESSNMDGSVTGHTKPVRGV